ncbi:MAG: heparan-alpha-glucosaminide N-acetyltransferase [Casimicrobiaceae bacterium]
MTAARDSARRTAKEAPATASARVPAIDVLRAFALFAMIGYHFAFDLRYFGVIRTDFEHDPYCLVVRGAILSSFLLLAGVSLVLADRAGVPPARFWRHVTEVAGCALLVSAGSYALFPKTFIWFGVLHAITISLIVARPFARQPALAAAIGCAVIAAGTLLAHPAFDNRALGWIGFMTGKPYTEDYVPLFPWAGVVFVGIALGHFLAHRSFAPIAALNRAPQWLAALGRHTLLIYMIHQPILLGALWLALQLTQRR